MTENPHSDDDLNQSTRPFAIPNVAEVVDPLEENAIERESLSWSGMLAWLTICLVTLAMISLTAFSRSALETRTEATSSDLFPVQLQGRSLVGPKAFFGNRAAKSDNESDDDEDSSEDDDSTEKTSQHSGSAVPAALNEGTYEQRLCYVLLVNENHGPSGAAEKLQELDDAAEEADFVMSDNQVRLRNTVGSIIESHLAGDMDSESVSEEDREFLKEKLGWIGELALVPEGTRNVATRKELLSDASWSMGIMMGFMLIVLLTLMAGVALAAMYSVFFATGRFKPTFVTHGKSVNVYIETFALWMVFFFGGPQLTAIGLSAAGVELSGGLDMGISIGFFFGSLIVLVYPMLRGISFRQLCDDIGWKGKNGFVDVLISPLTYIAGTPMMFCGMICVLVLTIFASLLTGPKPFGTSVAPGHPIQDIISNGQWWSLGYVVLMACIAAPIVEETMFRGVLYRHLRELSGGWARWGSVIFSAVFNGLIFAAIHPQGFVAIPLLTALAINFSLAREWRDSLIAPMIMHGINNGAVTMFMFLMMS